MKKQLTILWLVTLLCCVSCTPDKFNPTLMKKKRITVIDGTLVKYGYFELSYLKLYDLNRVAFSLCGSVSTDILDLGLAVGFNFSQLKNVSYAAFINAVISSGIAIPHLFQNSDDGLIAISPFSFYAFQNAWKTMGATPDPVYISSTEPSFIPITFGVGTDLQLDIVMGLTEDVRYQMPTMADYTPLVSQVSQSSDLSAFAAIISHWLPYTVISDVWKRRYQNSIALIKSFSGSMQFEDSATNHVRPSFKSVKNIFVADYEHDPGLLYAPQLAKYAVREHRAAATNVGMWSYINFDYSFKMAKIAGSNTTSQFNDTHWIILSSHSHGVGPFPNYNSESMYLASVSHWGDLKFTYNADLSMTLMDRMEMVVISHAVNVSPTLITRASYWNDYKGCYLSNPVNRVPSLGPRDLKYGTVSEVGSIVSGYVRDFIIPDAVFQGNNRTHSLFSIFGNASMISDSVYIDTLPYVDIN